VQSRFTRYPLLLYSITSSSTACIITGGWDGAEGPSLINLDETIGKRRSLCYGQFLMLGFMYLIASAACFAVPWMFRSLMA
jgi:hypothetical protein